MSSREEFEAWVRIRVQGAPSGFYPQVLYRNAINSDAYMMSWVDSAWEGWQANSVNTDLLTALLAITNSGPDAIPIKEAFEMAHRAIDRATGVSV